MQMQTFAADKERKKERNEKKERSKERKEKKVKKERNAHSIARVRESAFYSLKLVPRFHHATN